MTKKKERKLSKAEERRKIEFEKMRANLLSQGYEEKELTCSVLYANVMAIVVAIPIILIMSILFSIAQGKRMIVDINISLLCLAFIALIVIHELIHGLCWGIIAKGRFKVVEFGFILECLTPYCTCKEPLKKSQYILGLIMPTIIVGILPCIISCVSGSKFLFLLGVMMIIGGGGDIIIMLKLLRFRSKANDAILIDHPYQIGLVAFEKFY